MPVSFCLVAWTRLTCSYLLLAVLFCVGDSCPAAKRVWHPNPQVRGELTWSGVSPNRASGPGLLWPKKHLNPHEGSGQRWTKQVRTLCRCSFWLGDYVQVTNKGCNCSRLCVREQAHFTCPPKTLPLCVCLGIW
jgi:hypothetical protein